MHRIFWFTFSFSLALFLCLHAIMLSPLPVNIHLSVPVFLSESNSKSLYRSVSLLLQSFLTCTVSCPLLASLLPGPSLTRDVLRLLCISHWITLPPHIVQNIYIPVSAPSCLYFSEPVSSPSQSPSWYIFFFRCLFLFFSAEMPASLCRLYSDMVKWS